MIMHCSKRKGTNGFNEAKCVILLMSVLKRNLDIILNILLLRSLKNVYFLDRASNIMTQMRQVVYTENRH